jgi:VanZ family protein
MVYLLWILSTAWAAGIYYVSSMPGANVPSVVPDYVPHSIEYAILAMLVWFALRFSLKQKPAGFISLWAICITSFYAVSDEFHQSFVPGRTPDIKDWAVDTIAAAAVIAVLWFVKARLSRR